MADPLLPLTVSVVDASTSATFSTSPSLLASCVGCGYGEKEKAPGDMGRRNGGAGQPPCRQDGSWRHWVEEEGDLEQSG